MNYKISLAALAVASVLSGQALAALTPAENTALAALAPVSTWTAANWSTSLDGTALTNTVDWADGVDECTWRGVICDGPAGNITHIEIPNSGMTADMDVVLAALTPAAASLLVLNVSTTSVPANVHAGDMSALATFPAMTHLAINGSGAVGIIPDMSGATSLNYVNVYNNVGITGMAGKLAGGSAITLIGTNGNTNMVGDMSSTLANVANPVNLTLNNSKVYGDVVLGAGDVVALTGTDIIPTGDATAITNSGFNAANVIQPAAGATVTPGEESAVIAWTQPVVGQETGYDVSYSADNGVTLLGTTAVTTTTHSFAGVPAGTYKAVVQATGPDSRKAAPTLSADFIVTAAVTPPVTPTCADGETLNTTTNECETDEEETTSSGGGGAAFWLILLPLMGLLRRKSV